MQVFQIVKENEKSFNLEKIKKNFTSTKKKLKNVKKVSIKIKGRCKSEKINKEQWSYIVLLTKFSKSQNKLVIFLSLISVNPLPQVTKIHF